MVSIWYDPVMDTVIYMGAEMRLNDEDPCAGCTNKVIDDWGWFCDIWCGKHSTHLIRQEAYKAQLKKVVEWCEEPCPHYQGLGKRECDICWQALLEEIK